MEIQENQFKLVFEVRMRAEGHHGETRVVQDVTLVFRLNETSDELEVVSTELDKEFSYESECCTHCCIEEVIRRS